MVGTCAGLVLSELRSQRRIRGTSQPTGPVFPNARGIHLSRDGIQYIVRKHARAASQRCGSLKDKRVSPHVLRHTTTMNLLPHGVDRSVIARWLGYESVDTTDVYLDANLQMKARARARTISADGAAAAESGLSARADGMILRAARPIADLVGVDDIQSEKASEAIIYRWLHRQLRGVIHARDAVFICFP